MRNPTRFISFVTRCLAATSLTLAGSAIAQAQPATPVAAAPESSAMKSAPLNLSPEFALRLVELLVKKGQLSQSEADALVAEASTPSATRPDGTIAAETRAALRDEPNAIVVPYIPESVRKRIKDELRAELNGEIVKKGWVREGEVVPPWTQAITLSGDFRVRGESIWYGRSNAADLQGNLRPPKNYAAINAGTGTNININSTSFVGTPYLNSDQRRGRARIRARLGLDARVDDWISFSGRLATGNDNSPVSTNQTLGNPGQLSKYAIWLDRAYLRFAFSPDIHADVGRMPNPFWTGELIFDNDLNFDGIAVSGSRKIGENLGLFARAGAFPIFNTDLNFGSNSSAKFKSNDKYLLAAQLGVDLNPIEDVEAKLAVGYFDFTKVQGRLSSPCFVPTGAGGQLAPTAADSCDTDATRPSFQQFGNTMFQIRDVTVPVGTDPILEYYGLASKFRVLDVKGQVSFPVLSSYRAVLNGEYIRNLAFKRGRITADYLKTGLLDNNFGPSVGGVATYGGTGDGWSASVNVGSPSIEKWLDWNLGFEYRRVGTDATVDGFADSDFHLGGTNAKGFIFAGTLGLAKNTQLQARWFSADVVTGPAYSNDILFIDLMAKF